MRGQNLNMRERGAMAVRARREARERKRKKGNYLEKVENEFGSIFDHSGEERVKA